MTEHLTEWPPENIQKYLDRNYISIKLAEIKDRLTKFGFRDAQVLDVIQEVLFEALQDFQTAARYKALPLNPLASFRKPSSQELRYREEDDWWSFLFAVCVNRLKRQSSQVREVPYRTEPEARAPEFDEAPSNEEPPKLARSSIEKLELKERAVYVLLKEGFSQAEISQLMRLTPARVSQLKSSAISRLRNLFWLDRGDRDPTR